MLEPPNRFDQFRLISALPQGKWRHWTRFQREAVHKRTQRIGGARGSDPALQQGSADETEGSRQDDVGSGSTTIRRTPADHSSETDWRQSRFAQPPRSGPCCANCKSQQEIAAACKGVRANHVGMTITRHKRAGRIEERDAGGLRYALNRNRAEHRGLSRLKRVGPLRRSWERRIARPRCAEAVLVK